MRTAVLVSGSGSNLQALLDAPRLAAEVSLVLSDRPGAKALDRAGVAGIDTAVVPWSGNRETFTTQLCDAIEAAGCELVVLAGFMRILGREAVERYPNRIINIHPAALPAFPGAHAVEAALEYGVKQTGVTVHFVDEQVDHGPIIAQQPVEVLPGDDVASLHARIQLVEHELYPACVNALAQGRLTIEGRTVIWS